MNGNLRRNHYFPNIAPHFHFAKYLLDVWDKSLAFFVAKNRKCYVSRKHNCTATLKPHCHMLIQVNLSVMVWGCCVCFGACTPSSHWGSNEFKMASRTFTGQQSVTQSWGEFEWCHSRIVVFVVCQVRFLTLTQLSCCGLTWRDLFTRDIPEEWKWNCFIGEMEKNAF